MNDRKAPVLAKGPGTPRPAFRADIVGPLALHRRALARALVRSGAFATVEEHVAVESGSAGTGYDVTVVDLPALGVAAVQQICAGRATLAWGGYLHSGAVAALVETGLRGYVSVIALERELALAAMRVAAGVAALPSLDTTSVRLTPAELRACQAYLVDGADAPRALVAAELGISERTLKVHLANVRAKVGSTAANRVELARELRARGILR
ncbi:LuxR C-terminal-related transcriptional regulator [Flexivirga caeni]|uniref:DNA-binding response regulator n=1 Tax=Flexivirga caeni TaxID=2294115 RepID=A0A3M9MF86_9MICO|nr:LuxR C-terminal-related transcriptional regulator [Flexivirga caeni]RNI24211.1 DNA-binding response regulator [Flexivirga caeni]